MNSTENRTLPNAADKSALKTMAITVVQNCPGLQDSAHEVAGQLLTQQGLTGLDPDRVYFHRFKAAQSSTKSFTGWEHIREKPYESKTLTQLVIHRFRATDQDNADLLDLYAGFYTAGPESENFNETNEVRLHGDTVLKAFWSNDFSTLYTDRLNTFWGSHSTDFRTLAKCEFLAKAVQALDERQLSADDFQFAVNAVMPPVVWPVSLSTLQTTHAAGPEVRALDIAGHVAVNVLRIVDPKGRQILYLPGETRPFLVMETATDLHWWVLEQMNDDSRRKAFLVHFSLADRQTMTDNLSDLMNRLVSTWGKAEHQLINQKNQTVSGDAFSWLRDRTHNAMLDEASQSLTSNGDLRKKMWIGYLSAGLRVFGPMAVVGWPVALPLIGASIASLGLNIDQAVNGRTAAERKAGVTGAIISSIDTLFNVLSLKGPEMFVEIGPEAEEAEATEMAELKQADEQPELEPAQQAGEPDLPQAEFRLPTPGGLAPNLEEPVFTSVIPDNWETNEILEGQTLITEPGKYNGIYRLRSNPSTAIMLNDRAYYVRYENDLNGPGHWAVIDPENPGAWSPSIPVRLNAEGEWEAMPRNGLRGGGKPGATAAALPPYVSYEVPPQLRDRLSNAAHGFEDKWLSDSYGISGPGAPYGEFKAIRKQLHADAEQFFANPTLPPRPPIPPLEPHDEWFEMFKGLLSNSRGVVIGESHAEIAGKQLLVDSMGWLKTNDVKTLYMEHLLTDFHQTDLDLFGKTGLMPKGLELDLARLDAGHMTDPLGRYNFSELVKAAQKHGIRVQAIDCMASYRTKGMDFFTSAGESRLDPLARQKMMNFYARNVIRADQAARGAHKWVALVGNTHSNTFEGVPGISEMEEAIGLRVEDVAENRSSGVIPDPGRQLAQSQLNGSMALVKGDLRLQVETPWAGQQTQSLDELLPRKGMYTLKQEPQGLTLVHRSNNGALVHTAIGRENGLFFITRHTWPSISNQRFNSMPALLKSLDRMGMKLAGWSRPQL